MKIKKLILALLLVTTLAACGSTSKDQAADDEREQAEMEKKEALAKKAADTYKQHLICPQVAAIRDLSVYRDFGGNPPTANNLVTAAAIKTIKGSCTYSDDGIDISFSVTFAGQKGPRFSGDDKSFPFFIAVVDPNQNILNKDQTATNLNLKNGQIAEREESLHVFIPLTKEKRTLGPNYRVLAGFQLTAEQLNQARTSQVVKQKNNQK